MMKRVKGQYSNRIFRDRSTEYRAAAAGGAGGGGGGFEPMT